MEKLFDARKNVGKSASQRLGTGRSLFLARWAILPIAQALHTRLPYIFIHITSLC